MCLILPLFRFCNGSIPPLVAPPICWPYLCGFLIGAAALVHPASVRVFAFLLRALVVGFTIGWVIAFHETSIPGNIVTVCAATVAMISLWPGTYDRVCARTGFAVGAAACGWFGTLLASEDIMWGAYVALVSSAVMTLGCAWWWWETRRSSAMRVSR